MAAFFYGTPEIAFYQQMEGSQDNPVSTTAQTYKAIWKVAWADVEAAKVALIGRTTALPAAGSLPAFFSRAIPHAHPKAPWLFCEAVTRTEGREPRGADGDGMASYRSAFLYCLYTKPNCAILDDNEPSIQTAGRPDEYRLGRFVKKRRRNATEFHTSRIGSWRWLDTAPPRTVGFEIPWRRPKLRLLLTWRGIPIANLNEAEINACIGTTNLEAFAGFSAQSLRLNGADWPDWNPIPGRDGFQVDVTFDIVAYNSAIGDGPNFFSDPLRANTYHEVGTIVSPGPPAVILSPFPVRTWKDMFKPIGV